MDICLEGEGKALGHLSPPVLTKIEEQMCVCVCYYKKIEPTHPAQEA